jgi:hypothetical protein
MFHFFLLRLQLACLHLADMLLISLKATYMNKYLEDGMVRMGIWSLKSA